MHKATPETCVGCGGPLGPPDWLGASALARCASCGTRTAVPRPSKADAIALHDSVEYFEKTYFEARRGRDATTRQRAHLVFDRLARELPDRSVRHKRLLDVGCDTGDFLVAARELAGVEPFGVDIAARAVELARAKGITAACADLGSAPPDFTGFALITAIDVIEHVPNPTELLDEARRRLAPDGVVYLETPNWRSSVYVFGRITARLLRGRPHRALARLFPPEHFQYFTPQGLQALAERAGYSVVSVSRRPLRGDALAGGPLLKAFMELLQLPDRLLDREILLTAVLVPRTDE